MAPKAIPTGILRSTEKSQQKHETTMAIMAAIMRCRGCSEERAVEIHPPLQDELIIFPWPPLPLAPPPPTPTSPCQHEVDGNSVMARLLAPPPSILAPLWLRPPNEKVSYTIDWSRAILSVNGIGYLLTQLFCSFITQCPSLHLTSSKMFK